MKTYGKLSFLLFVIFGLSTSAVPAYLIYLGRVDTWILALLPLNIGLLVWVAYKTYITISVSHQELVIAYPLKKEKTTYFINNIHVVTFDKYKNDANKTVKRMTVQKIDKTSDVYELSGFFFESSPLKKELNQYVDIL